jgi:hypothetical protein
MASDFTLFSETLGVLTAEQIEWFKRQLEFVEREEGEDLPRFMQDAIEAGEVEFLEPDFGRNFQFEFQGESLWIFSDENGSPSHAAVLVQQFLRRFRSDGYWTIGWAATCSSPRAGEFGGGAMLVTANEILAESGWSFVERKLKELGFSLVSHDP